ncbi:AMP-binding protein [Tenacibaculum maritimum]|uniref:AMP-binding protein n=1 Tax=Tenacibaculum maritimum TaxID=107401 RepID=UPI00388E2092
MTENKYHKKFKLNGHSFASEMDVLEYTKKINSEIHTFLKEWFHKNDFITVKTSGSTGIPKAIYLKKELMKNSALATGEFFKLKEKTKALMCLSVGYIAGKMMLIRALTLGWELDIVPPNSYPLEKIEKEYDFTALVPMQLQNSLYKLHFIKKLIVGGGVVSKELVKKLEAVSTEVFATYGMTETITHIAVKQLNHCSSKKQDNHFYTVLPNVEIYKDKRECLVIKAPKVAEELVITNDVVALVTDTKFEWLGRFDTIINSGGIKLLPEKIEQKLSPIISQRFFVIGIPDEKLGEKLVLILEGIPSAEIKRRLSLEIQNLESLSKYEKPKEIYFTSQFIETATKKIRREATLNHIDFNH